VRRLRVKAIIFGAVVDIGGSFAAFAILMPALKPHGGSGLPPMVVQDAVGLAFSFLGGLVAARVARQREFLHAVAAVFPCFLLGVALPAEPGPLWHQLLSYVGMVPFALLGGYCSRGWNRAGTV
jgi:hypothetical protein